MEEDDVLGSFAGVKSAAAVPPAVVKPAGSLQGQQDN